MVVFNELRITNDGNNLIIKAKVRNESYFDNIYIDKVIIDTEDTYVEGTPSSSPVYSTTIEGNNKEVSLNLSYQIDTDLKDHLLFVYVVTKGTLNGVPPCGMDDTATLGVTMFMGDIYTTFMDYIKEIGSNNCQIPEDFIDTFLKFKGLGLAIDSGHYLQGIEYYKKWFKDIKQVSIISNCGCHG